MFGKLFNKGNEATFKERVDQFWEWFPTVAERYRLTIDEKRPSDLADELSAQVDLLGSGFAWEFGPGFGQSNYSLTISGEGYPHRQILAQYWCGSAPGVNGWMFYPSRQPGRMSQYALEIGERRFDGREIWLSPRVNLEEEKFDLEAWHPLWKELDERERFTMLFIFLDEVLGEYGTQQWVGKIEFSESSLKEAIPLGELAKFIEKTCEKEGWKKSVPGETGIVYQLEPHGRFERGDIAFGRTTFPRLMEDYLEAEGRLDDPLAGTGADYVYLTIGIEHLPKGEEVSTRGVFEDALDKELKAERMGLLLGGATGSRFGYIDLLVFDGERSVSLINKVLQDSNAPQGMRLGYFAKEKRKAGRKIS